MKTINPAVLVIEYFGGIRPTGRALNRSPGAVIKWKETGQLPQSIQRYILENAKQNHWNLTATDVVLGREERRVKRA